MWPRFAGLVAWLWVTAGRGGVLACKDAGLQGSCPSPHPRLSQTLGLAQMSPDLLAREVSVSSLVQMVDALAVVGVQDAWWLATDADHPVSAGWLDGGCTDVSGSILEVQYFYFRSVLGGSLGGACGRTERITCLGTMCRNMPTCPL